MGDSRFMKVVKGVNDFLEDVANQHLVVVPLIVDLELVQINPLDNLHD